MATTQRYKVKYVRAHDKYVTGDIAVHTAAHVGMLQRAQVTIVEVIGPADNDEAQTAGAEAGLPPLAPEEETGKQNTTPPDEEGPLPFDDIPANKRTAEQKAARQTEQARRDEAKAARGE